MTKPKIGTITSNLEPVPYQGNILGEYHQRGATNGWRAAQSSPATPRQFDETTATRRIAVQVTRIQHTVVFVEVMNATELDACTEARYLLERQPELLDAADTWSKPTVHVSHGRVTTEAIEPLASLCLREEYERRRDLHKNAVRIPLTFEKMEGKP